MVRDFGGNLKSDNLEVVDPDNQNVFKAIDF